MSASEVIDHPWIDSSQRPLYRWTAPVSALDEEVVALVEARELWAQSHQGPCAWVVDLSQVSNIPARQRGLVGEHLGRMRDFNRKHNVASAIVLRTSLVRGFLTAVFWLAPPTFPYRVFADVEAAQRWAAERLRVALAKDAGG